MFKWTYFEVIFVHYIELEINVNSIRQKYLQVNYKPKVPPIRSYKKRLVTNRVHDSKHFTEKDTFEMSTAAVASYT